MPRHPWKGVRAESGAGERVIPISGRSYIGLSVCESPRRGWELPSRGPGPPWVPQAPAYRNPSLGAEVDRCHRPPDRPLSASRQSITSTLIAAAADHTHVGDVVRSALGVGNYVIHLGRVGPLTFVVVQVDAADRAADEPVLLGCADGPLPDAPPQGRTGTTRWPGHPGAASRPHDVRWPRAGPAQRQERCHHDRPSHLCRAR